MAMKIPRYQGNLGSAPIQSGRNLSTGTGGAQGMVALGQTMLNSIAGYAEEKIKLEAKIRDQEILDKRVLAEGDSLMSANDFTFGLEGRKDYANFASEYEKSWEKSTAKVKKERFTNKDGTFDEYAWNRYLPFHNKQFVDGKVKVQAAISKARNAVTIGAYQTNYDATNVKLEGGTSVAEVMGNWSDWYNNTYTSYKGNSTFDQGTLDTSHDALKKVANTQLFKIYSGVNGKPPMYMNPDGKQSLDWGTVYRAAADPNVKMYDVDGKEVTVDDAQRAEFIKMAKDKSTEQTSYDENSIKVKNRENNDSFSKRIAAVYAGKKDPSFMDDLLKSGLDGESQKTHASNYKTAITALASGVKYWDTPEGRQTDGLVTAMVLSGMIDTEDEKSTIYGLVASGQLSPERGTTLTTQIEKQQTDRNSHKVLMYKNAVRTILKEAGAPQNILNQLDSMQAGSVTGKNIGDIITSMTGDPMSENAYVAVNNLTKLIAEGEKKGLTMNEMLMNPNSPNYIMRDLIEVYKENFKKERIKDFDIKASAYINMSEDVKKFGNYRIDPVAWANYNNRATTIKMPPVPPRAENEPINTYLMRLQKWNQKTSAEATGLPSFLRSDVVGGESSQGGVVLPSGTE